MAGIYLRFRLRRRWRLLEIQKLLRSQLAACQVARAMSIPIAFVHCAIIMSSWFSPIGGIVHQVISTPNRFNIQEDKLEFLTSKKSSKKKKLMVKQKTFVSQASRHLMLYRELVALINQVEYFSNIPTQSYLWLFNRCFCLLADLFTTYSRVSNNRTYVRLNQKESFHSHVEHSNWY